MSKVNSLFGLVLLMLSVTGWSMDAPAPRAMKFSTYDDLSAEIIKIAKAAPISRKTAAWPILNKLGQLQSSGDQNVVFAELIKIVQVDNGHIKLADLANVLGALRTKFPTASQEEGDKIVELFSSLILGKKTLQNVAIIGRTRVGKSTFLATMKDPLDRTLRYSITSNSNFSHTEHSSHHFLIFDSVENGFYAARFIDTPGLKEAKSPDSKMQSREDAEVIDEIVQSMKGLTIHKVIQICTYQTSGINIYDESAFKSIKHAFAESGIFSGPIDLVFPLADEILSDEFMKNTEVYLSQRGITTADYGNVNRTGTIFNADFEHRVREKVEEFAIPVFVLRNAIIQNVFDDRFLEGLQVISQSETECEADLDEYTKSRIQALMFGEKSK